MVLSGSIKEAPQRSAVDPRYQWVVQDVFASDEDWERAFAETKALTAQAEAFRGRLQEGPETLLAFLRLQDELSLSLERVFLYASMRRDEDNTVAKYQAMRGRAHSLWTEISAALAFFAPELMQLPEETLSAWAARPELAEYRRSLEKLLRMRAHTLSEAEESLLAESGELAAVPQQSFAMLNNADMQFPVIRDEEGGETRLTHGNYIHFMQSGKREVREGAFRALYGTYGSFRNTLAATYGGSVKKDGFYAAARRFPSALAASLYHDDVSLKVYEQLIATVREGLPAFYRYLELRKRLLGVDELHMWDVYAPLCGESRRKYSYEEACAIVREALAPLGPEYGRLLAEGLASGWVDAMENAGKTPGAHSTGCYGCKPYVLMNFQGDLDSVFTLAHELGHSMHSLLSWQTQPYADSDYCIFVAEVASTVNEILLLRHLLAKAESKEERVQLLNHYLEEFRGTVYRQTMFAEFEKLSHEKAAAGEALTEELLSDIYYQLNLDYFGPGMQVDEEIRLEWARIPHFYNAFYVYKYATGFSAATALAEGILSQGAPAVARYLDFLRSGDSDWPIPLLRRAGVDMESAEPVRAAIGVFSRLTEELAAELL